MSPQPFQGRASDWVKNWYICLLRGYYIPNQKLACFVLYLEIIDTILKKNISILK